MKDMSGFVLHCLYQKQLKKNLFISHELFLVADDKSNRFLQNDGTSQKLSRDEIMNLKAQGVSGKVSLV